MISPRSAYVTANGSVVLYNLVCTRSSSSLFHPTKIARPIPKKSFTRSFTGLVELRSHNDAGFDAELGTVDSNTAAPYTPWTRWSENFHNDTAMSSYDLSYYLGRQSLGTVLQIHRRELGDWSPALGPQHWVVLEKQHTVMTFELARSNASQANETARDAYRTAMKERPQSWVTLTKARISLARVMLFYGLHDKAEGLARELLKSFSGSSNEMPTAIEAGHYQYVAEAKHLLASACICLRRTLFSNFKSARSCERLATVEARLGDQYPLCFEHMVRLALLIRHSSRLAHPEAKTLFKRAHRLTRKGYGDDHEMALVAQQHQRILVRDVLSFIVRREPDQFRQELIEHYQRTLGNFSPATINAMDNGVELLLQRNREAEALKLMEQVVRLAAVTYRNVPAQLEAYRRRYRGMVAEARWARLLGNHWYHDYAYLPFAFDRLFNKERFQRRYELVVWPIYRVKARFKKYERFEFDWSKDPDHREQDRDLTDNVVSEILNLEPRLIDYVWGPRAYRPLQLF